MEIEHFTYLVLTYKQLFIRTGYKYEFMMNRLIKKTKWVNILEVEHLQSLNVMFKQPNKFKTIISYAYFQHMDKSGIYENFKY